MKTSKIIFISLLTAIAVFIIAAFVDIRINGSLKSTSPIEITLHKQKVSQFKVVYVQNSKNIRFVQGDSSYIELAWIKDSIPPKINYLEKNDTLIISDLKLLIGNPAYTSLKIYSTEALRTITAKDSEIAIESIGSGRMSVYLDNSSAWISQHKSKKVYYSNLNIIARNQSSANTNNFRVDSLRIILQNSESKLAINANRISGTLSESSKITFPKPGEISLKIDSTSNIIIN